LGIKKKGTKNSTQKFEQGPFLTQNVFVYNVHNNLRKFLYT